jgi:hypothetical protein
MERSQIPGGNRFSDESDPDDNDALPAKPVSELKFQEAVKK